jgi:hypothetical protein
MVLLSHIYFNLVANQFKYYKVSARITNSKSFRGWRAKAFVLADDCNGFYFGDESTTIYYENDDLSLAVLFKTKDEARKFRSTLEKRAFSFCIISSVLVNEVYEEVVLLSEALAMYFLAKFQQASAKRSTAGILLVERARSASLCTTENELMDEREARVFAQRRNARSFRIKGSVYLMPKSANGGKRLISSRLVSVLSKVGPFHGFLPSEIILKIIYSKPLSFNSGAGSG